MVHWEVIAGAMNGATHLSGRCVMAVKLTPRVTEPLQTLWAECVCVCVCVCGRSVDAADVLYWQCRTVHGEAIAGPENAQKSPALLVVAA